MEKVSSKTVSNCSGLDKRSFNEIKEIASLINLDDLGMENVFIGFSKNRLREIKMGWNIDIFRQWAEFWKDWLMDQEDVEEIKIGLITNHLLLTHTEKVAAIQEPLYSNMTKFSIYTNWLWTN